MNDYRIFETRQFEKDLHSITEAGQAKVVDKLRNYVYPALRKHPHFGPHVKRLKGFEPATWRYRIGSWRFFFEIDEESAIVVMLAASHRSRAY